MESKLLALWAKVQPLLSKAYACAPFVAGLVVGYVCHPVIKLALSVVLKLLRLV